MRSLRQAWGAGVGLPATKWMLEIGASSAHRNRVILKSRRVVPQRLPDSGFEFCFSDWPSAARDLVSRWRNGSIGPTCRQPARLVATGSIGFGETKHRCGFHASSSSRSPVDHADNYRSFAFQHLPPGYLLDLHSRELKIL